VKRFWSGLIVVAVMTCAGASQSQVARWSVVKLISEQTRVHDRVGVQDVYKLLFQANFGVEHLLNDTAAVREYLAEELAGLDTSGADEVLLERISTDGALVRVNLRPFKRLHHSPAGLIKAMILSASAVRPDSVLFLRQWEDFMAAVHAGLLSFPLGEIRSWDRRIRTVGIQAVHHSPGYTAANRPAYRVAVRDIVDSLVTRGGLRTW
jgi:hypothetical protein